MTSPMNPPRIQETPLRLDALLAETERPDCGGLVVFSGDVRDHHDGKHVLRLIYTAHVPVADRVIREIEDEAVLECGAAVCRIVHRIGPLAIGEPAVLVVARAAHRAEAFAAARYGIDEVKQRVPIWKEEFYDDGTRAFVSGCSLVP
jgi:molybdopterin synthase catalytic subunit